VYVMVVLERELVEREDKGVLGELCGVLVMGSEILRVVRSVLF